MHKFFVEKIKEENPKKAIFYLEKEELHHLKNVFRLKKGDTCLFTLGDGWDFEIRIEEIGTDAVTGKILRKEVSDTEPDVEIVLYQGLPKAQKMEWIIQKAVELGVKEIVPMTTKRTVVKLNEEKADKRLKRWQKIAKEAVKQCGGSRIPLVRDVISFENAVLEKTEGIKLIPYEDEKTAGLKNAIQQKGEKQRFAVMIGPEGGFDPEEVLFAKENGALPVTLGKRILRTETAGFVAISAILYEVGEMG